MDASKFNTWFNEKFDKFRMHDEEQDNGYEDWFRGVSRNGDGEDEDNDDDSRVNESPEMGGTWAERNAKIEEKKAKLRNKMSLIQRNEIQTANSSGAGGGYYGLGREAPQEYSSGLFSSLQYEDLKMNKQ